MERKFILAFAFLMSCLLTQASTMLPDNDNPPRNSKTENKAEIKKLWEFYSTVGDMNPDQLADESNYVFGNEAGCLYNMFMETYVVREEVVPGDPTRRTVIRKPTIYNAVRTVEKMLNKSIKSSSISKEQAMTDFTNVLKIALSAIDSDTDSFEDELQKNRKDATNLLLVFKSVKLIEI